MSVAVITGSAGLVGSSAARHFADLGLEVVGIDNDLRRKFFGDEASTLWQRSLLEKELGKRYSHVDADIRDRLSLEQVFKWHGRDIKLVIHTAAQPSHDWAASEPLTDFTVNALGTLHMLEATRQFCPEAAFIFTSTNKVYGDRPNSLPLVELPTRWEIDQSHPYTAGIPEEMSIDGTLHSLFGASKASADLLVQEYGRYFGMQTVCFRGGCLTGPNHSGTQLHGFLAYLMRCCVTGTPYNVYGYKGKQVRDNIHSDDLVRAFEAFFRAPKSAEIYNIGGGRDSNASMLESIAICERIAQRPLNWRYVEQNRTGDHIWWVSSLARFRSHYPAWRLEHNVDSICQAIYEHNVERWQQEPIHAG